MHKFQAIWDTGASGSVITQAVVDQCGLKPIGMRRVYGVGGVYDAHRYLVNIGLPNMVAFANIDVIRGEDLVGGAQVLIGMDLITQGDFSISNQNGNTLFSFRVPSQHTQDFVKLERTPVNVAAVPGRNEPCPCQSGKKFKHCHGAK